MNQNRIYIVYLYVRVPTGRQQGCFYLIIKMAVGTQEIPKVSQEKLAAIRKKYDEEASKRLRPEGPAQFVQLTESDE